MTKTTLEMAMMSNYLLVDTNINSLVYTIKNLLMNSLRVRQKNNQEKVSDIFGPFSFCVFSRG